MQLVNIIDTGIIMGLLLGSIVASLGISFRLLNFPDLTIDGSFAFGAVICATMVKNDYPVVLAIFLSLICGGISGVATAILHTKLKINKFLSGIIVVTALYSILIRIMHGGNVSFGQKATFFDYVSKWNFPGSFSLGTNVLLSFFVFLIAGISIWLLKSRYGIRLRAACLNTELSKSIGLSTSVSLMIGLFYTNALAAFSGSLFSLKSSYADIGYMQGMLIVSLASLTIGEKIIPIKKFNRVVYIILASISGSIVYQFIWAVALQLNFEPSDLNLITAVIVIVLFTWKHNTKNSAGVELQ